MDEKERHERGMARRRKVLGNEWVDRANAKKTPFNEEFQELITRYAWGEVWTRPGLSRPCLSAAGRPSGTDPRRPPPDRPPLRGQSVRAGPG